MAPKLIPGGLLIAIEGIDGAGKTTLARALTAAFENIGVSVSMSKEPTAGPHGAQLRQSAAGGRLPPEREVELLLLDRREHVEQVIGPALSRGSLVVLDRYFPSMVAYQGAAGVDVEQLMRANEFAPRPDVLILLDLDPATGLARIESRGDKPNAFEDSDTLTKCRAIFRSLAARLPNMVIIDANDPIADVSAIAQRHVLTAISSKLTTAHGTSAETAERLIEYLPAL